MMTGARVVGPAFFADRVSAVLAGVASDAPDVVAPDLLGAPGAEGADGAWAGADIGAGGGADG